MTNEIKLLDGEDAQYLLQFGHKVAESVSMALTKATLDLERLAYVIHESTVSRRLPFWNLLPNVSIDNAHDNESKLTSVPNTELNASSDSEQPATPNSKLTGKEADIALAMINKQNGTRYTLADLEAANTMLDFAKSPVAGTVNSISTSSAVANCLPTLRSIPNTDIENDANLKPEDVDAANILLDLSKGSTAADVTKTPDVGRMPKSLEKANGVPAEPKAKKKNTRKRKMKIEPDFKDSDYPHHKFLEGIDPSKGPAKVISENARASKRTRSRH